ncbi:MAG TPA: helix-turn-helix transcriptional regulator [Longimicrobium sp.]|jgi:transcriptional regulator with XRE-family HTH domain|uniref:helix-turn-helix domain-containing protein n=1 Tax=Longimicrobium sp. TaxID=2029185 RepID=UPI002ED8C451
MITLDSVIAERKANDPGFAEDFDRGYQAFRLGVMLQVAREDAGMTQEQVAQKLGTRKSAISRLENNAGDLRLSTLQKYAEAVGRRLILELAPPEAEQKPVAIRKPRQSPKLVAADSQS